jgi:hypothetical protein
MNCSIDKRPAQRLKRLKNQLRRHRPLLRLGEQSRGVRLASRALERVSGSGYSAVSRRSSHRRRRRGLAAVEDRSANVKANRRLA